MTRIEAVAPRGVTDSVTGPQRSDPAVDASGALADEESGAGLPFSLPAVSLSETPSLVPTLSLADRAAADAYRVVALLDGANEQHIQAGEIVCNAIVAYRNEPEAFTRFVAVLVQASVLTRRDGELSARSAKLKKLEKIGAYADFLRRTELSRRVRGFSALYQAVVLLETLPGDRVEQTESLMKLIDDGEASGVLSREYLERETAKVKSEKRIREEARTDRADDAEASVSEFVSEVDLVLMTPTDADLRRIRQTFLDEGSISLCGRVHERCASSATLVAAAPLHALPVVEKWLSMGFEKPRFFLAERAEESDVTDATIIVVATRGDAVLTGAVDWGEANDLAKLAERIAPDSRRRLHVFANETHDGWSALVGYANWRMDW